MKIARVFPRKTAATPDDPLAFFGPQLMLALPEIDEVHVSVTFTYDRPKAEALAYQWEMVGVPVKVGGPAYNDPAGEFTPGLYLKHGYTITSRGCNNHCWFCMASQREGCLRELEIKDAVEAAVQEYITWQESTIGRDLNPDKLVALVIGAGAKRLEVRAPVKQVITQTEIFKHSDCKVVYGGLEDD